jgi:hypothetical protein
MNTAIIIAELLLRYGPEVAQRFQVIFATPTPTPAQWDEVWALSRKSFDDYRNEARREIAS